MANLFLHFSLGLLLVCHCTLGHTVPSESQKIMISGPSPLAVQAGLKVARLGGNVVDVAIATELALAVTAPYYAALGGGGFAIIKFNGKVDVLDFREMAPMGATEETFSQRPIQTAQDGGLAVAVPGVPAGLKALHEKYGKLHWSALFDEAILLANKGFEVTGEWVRNTSQNRDRFNPAGKKSFFKPDGTSYLPGDRLEQKALGKLLAEMRNRGPTPFYEGPISHDIVESVRKAGGVIASEDLRSYKVRWLKPLESDFAGYKLYLMPPPSSGGVVISTALSLIEKKELRTKAPLGTEELHLLGEILKASFRGRALLGDPDFTKNPIARLKNEKYLTELANGIKEKSVSTFAPLKAEEFKESAETTHFSVMDKDGNAIAFTVTLNGSYGSGVVTEKYGVALNNEIDDFTVKPNEPNQFGLVQGRANSIQAKKRPLSSMSPTIVEKNGKTVMALGSPGGPRIISAVLQVLYRVLITGYNMDEAIQAGRIHHQLLPDILYVDSKRHSPETLEALKLRGHKIEESTIAKVFGVRVNEKGVLEGAYDSRGEGLAIGF